VALVRGEQHDAKLARRWEFKWPLAYLGGARPPPPGVAAKR
jgi:hypothetical protein